MIDDFLMELNPKQREICLNEKNYLIVACPGSGKTRTITYRLAYMAEKYRESEKWNIAITYTNRAADEIENRLLDMSVRSENVWTGTIHQFCMTFIIRPYAMYSERLKTGYTIIDEYTVDAYGREIAKALGIECEHFENPLQKPGVRAIYEKRLIERKEIDFEQILSVSEQLLKGKKFIAKNVSQIIRSIHVDEFQDTHEDQNQILSSLLKENKIINIIFVGDINQAIYGNLGGIAKSKEELESLLQVEITEEKLSGCYRSTQRIIDYYTNFEIFNTGIYCCSEKLKDIKGTISYDMAIKKSQLIENICEIIKSEIGRGIPEEEICIIAPQWTFLFQLSEKLKVELPNNHFDAPDISPFKYDPLNPFYLMAKLIYTTPGYSSHIRKKIAREVLIIMRNEFEVVMNDDIEEQDLLFIINGYHYKSTEEGVDYYESCVRYVLKEIGINIEIENNLKDTLEIFLRKTKERIKKYKIENTNDGIKGYFYGRKGIVLSTIHGVKGEEYNTVIAFALLNGYLPHWDYIYKKSGIRDVETKKLLYVLCSRARENLYLFSETGRVTNSGNQYIATDELKNISYKYDV